MTESALIEENSIQVEGPVENQQEVSVAPLNSSNERLDLESKEAIYLKKSPISQLIELCSREHIYPPLFSTEMVCDSNGFPQFKTSVVAFGMKASETAGRKRLSKHKACALLLDMVKESGVDIYCETKKTSKLMVNFSNADFDPKKEFTSDVAGPSRRRNNPVGWLQEFCTSKGWLTPTYTLMLTEGAAHEPKFYVTCSLMKFFEVGAHRTKRGAKREAANKVWRQVFAENVDVITKTFEELRTE
ncbi:interferon-inducible double-stranded RNA-dependent protein kinase activator A homolog A-like [Ctenocephalides felis]|uniref:interferon-inducible double-stranded RNA-dependent protein kinase activator A homolog A-like n=1 Tax=Ctenocephalides felis TaxID=7515 RepID=UPI000E6E3992|nr:interferon-inducible double-stranded RNA-dependent protein kinase activator A homolog A-like [Ctenocephalides felis]